MKVLDYFKKISLWLILSIPILSILLVVPITDSFIDQTKNYILFFGGILVLFLFIIKILKEKAIRISVSPVTAALLFFGLATAASTFFTSNYPVEALLGMGGIYISATIISILGGSLIPKNSISKFIHVMTISSMALIVLTILQLVGFGPAQLISKVVNINLPENMLFSIVGSSFIALQIVAITIIGIITNIVTNKKISKFFAISLPVLVIGAGIFAWSLLPGKETTLVLPSLSSSWSIMLDSIRNPKSALIGSGPSAYTNIYSTFKPLWINNTDQWAVTFSQASNFPLTLLSTMGIIGLLSWVFFVVKFIKLHKRSLKSSKPLTYMIGASLLLQVFMPINTIMLTIQAIAIAFLIANEKHKLPLLQVQALKFKVLNKHDFNKDYKKPLNMPLYFSVAVGFIGVFSLLYIVGRSYQANIIMAQSSKAMNSNDLVKAYELQQEAVRLNPYMDVFRRRYSATNTIIAVTLSNKADISDAEKEQISSLLQQAVREAQVATTLDPMEFQNWSNLAQIYKNMIGVSEDAAQWTIQSYTTAIEKNPNDPVLRIELAEVFSSQENYEQALSIISQAINLKPDLAGSHFNLATILEKIDQPEAYREARISYQRTLVLLDSGSEDYTLVNKKIEDLESMMEEKGISLEPETQQNGQANTQNTLIDPSVQAPSIIDQNLNNADVVNTEEQPVDIGQNTTEQPPVEIIETDALKAME